VQIYASGGTVNYVDFKNQVVHSTTRKQEYSAILETWCNGFVTECSSLCFISFLHLNFLFLQSYKDHDKDVLTITAITAATH
jgi:hypothetical protein